MIEYIARCACLTRFARSETKFADLQDELRALFNRPVDLITEKSLKQDSFGVRVRAERVIIHKGDDKDVRLLE